ncbi:MAG: glycosyl hydrolase [Williamsia sp.]|nr:glycosyl hydrolase [Williamsia sp.]
MICHPGTTRSRRHLFLLLAALLIGVCRPAASHAQSLSALKRGFIHPPDSARPGVYWYFMDGNLTRQSMTADLESMKKAGIGNLVFLEVNVGIPRGGVDFLSEEWQNLFVHAVREAERLGIEITLGTGPGWAGSGGPWVKPEGSMQHLVASTVTVQGPQSTPPVLPVPPPRKPYFGVGPFTPELKKQWNDFYEDVAVLAFPTPAQGDTIADTDEKALYYREPYTSKRGVKPYLLSAATYPGLPASAIAKSNVIDLTNKLKGDGTIDWSPPAGNWTVMRFGRRNNGASTRPAPLPGVGFEVDKWDTVALNAHLDYFVGRLLQKIGQPRSNAKGGLKELHIDSWEMGAQNWTGQLRKEFIERRGYDPLPFYPVYTGRIVESPEISERFLWDLRQTSQELILDYHARQVKAWAHRHAMKLSIEPYDMNPAADLELGSIADIPMAEFWSRGFGFNSSFSCIEAASIAHVNGITTVPAEALTAENNEGWKQHPGSVKNQGDWAFAAGINHFYYHTFQNQFLPDSLRPGATMGPYGVHWDRNQTWWPLASGYHQYITRCQYMLQQGRTVADILYLAPEGAPHVFRPPVSAMEGDTMPDRKGYNFDGCAPGQLYKAHVEKGQVVFPGGARYNLLVLPAVETMTPALLEKISALVKAGATVVGPPPVKSPSLVGYPACDSRVADLVRLVWGEIKHPEGQTIRQYGKGKIIWGGALDTQIDNLYPAYDLTAGILRWMGIEQDFSADGPVRYTHRTSPGWDVYFVASTSGKPETIHAQFRSAKKVPRLWDPLTGEIKTWAGVTRTAGLTSLSLQLAPYQSCFIVFADDNTPAPTVHTAGNLPAIPLEGPWNLSFDPRWGGPRNIQFDQLADWTLRPEEGIKYYSGMAVYRKVFDMPAGVDTKAGHLYLDLGSVKNIARVKLNGKDLGVVWTAPWRVGITGIAHTKNNSLEIEVANLWANRLIGDEKLPDDGIRDGKWPDWLTKGLPRTSGRYTFTTSRQYKAGSPLLPSGLVGPVTIQTEIMTK